MSETDAPDGRRYRFGPFEADVRAGELRRQGVRIKLQDQPFQVLTMLLERPGDLVTREEIQRRLWPDTVVEFDSNLNAAVKRLREALGDSATMPRFVETVPRRGYRFIAGNPRAEAASAADPSIAVLPFRDGSPHRDQEYYCDGLTDELTDALTRVENLRVVSRTSAFQFKDKVADVRRIGADLRVGALLEGSLRRVGSRLLITARLTRVTDGCHVWSDRYECDDPDVFDIQDEITAAVVGALRARLDWNVRMAPTSRLILSRPTMTRDRVAHDLCLQGLYFWNRGDRESVLHSVECFEQAIGRDASYAFAYAALADAYLSLARLEADPDRSDRLRDSARVQISSYVRLVEENYRQQARDDNP